MVDYIEIEFNAMKFNIPKRDDVEEWKFWISVWSNEGAGYHQLQRTIDRHINEDNIRIRKNKLENLLDDNGRD